MTANNATYQWFEEIWSPPSPSPTPQFFPSGFSYSSDPRTCILPQSPIDANHGGTVTLRINTAKNRNKQQKRGTNGKRPETRHSYKQNVPSQIDKPSMVSIEKRCLPPTKVLRGCNSKLSVLGTLILFMNPWSYWHGCRLVSNKAIMMMPGCVCLVWYRGTGTTGHTHTLFNKCYHTRRTYLFFSCVAPSVKNSSINTTRLMNDGTSSATGRYSKEGLYELRGRKIGKRKERCAWATVWTEEVGVFFGGDTPWMLRFLR